MATTTFKPTDEQIILASFAARERKLADIRALAKTSPAIWITLIASWGLQVVLFVYHYITFPALLAMSMGLFFIGGCMIDYRRRLMLLSDALIEEMNSKSLQPIPLIP